MSSASLKTPIEIEKMRASGRITAAILYELKEMVKPGVKTRELEELAQKLIRYHRARSAFKGFEDFPATLCTSVNAVAVHGVPSGYSLKDGDLLGLDFGVRFRGYCSDAALTIGVGSVSEEAEKLLKACETALYEGIVQAEVGKRVGDIGYAIQKHVRNAGFHVVRDLLGHGIGRNLHELPQVPNFGRPNTGAELLEGMTLAVEPIVGMRTGAIQESDDGFGYETRDQSLSAHFEHTILIAKGKPEILTKL